MDYSQFLIMRGEISLLLVFLLIFLFDTFGGKKSLKGLSITACVLFALHTVWNIIPVDSATAFGGMYQTSPIASMVKTVLNIGTLIVCYNPFRGPIPPMSNCAEESFTNCYWLPCSVCI